MAEQLPPELKIPEISRFINRANQVRTYKPAIAYWCEYRALNQIVSKGLHSASPACGEYAAVLIERLENTKTERADDDAIVDNAAGQAYVEQFAQETFDRAERTLRANKVTRQTADTFDAAATFFDLTHEWGTPEPAILQKIKFSKWNAARILKAIREGNDPNDSNPKLEKDDDDVVELDPNDPEVQRLTGAPQPVTIQDVPETGDGMTSEPSPIAQADMQAPGEPYAPSPMTMSPAPPQPPHPVPPTQPIDLPPTMSPDVVVPSWNPPPPVPAPIPVSYPPPSAPAAVPAPVSNHRDLNQAQKHAKWAISALNFDDVPTAVQELRNALAALGES